ncbi:neuronal calcium sensor 1-like [Antedon mediterranea]|uniref:neuronal calcium sensor 1-like n=1 Tax=Antedon mediterranea TaxID=105859 RepID=UPI003AF45F10
MVLNVLDKNRLMGKSGSKLDSAILKDLQTNTHFSSKEISQWHRGFMKDCPDGSLHQHEFLSIYQQFFPFGDATKFATFVFKVFDDNQDGLIEFTEFIKALSVTSRGTVEDKLEWAFKLYDLDKDGYITEEEMTDVVDAIYKMVGTMVTYPEDESTPEKMVSKIFKKMDKNLTHKLSKEEFKDGCKLDPSIIKALCLYDGLV